MAQDTKAAKDSKPEGKSAVKKILIFSLGAIILIGGSIGATLYLTGALNTSVDHREARASEAHASKAQGSSHGSEAQGSSHGSVEGASNIPAQYVPLDPPFVVNFEDQGMLRYLQVSVAVMTRDKAVGEAVASNMPPIRNSLIMLFGSQNFASLGSTEGKEKLRNQALEEIQSILRKEIGQPGVEAVYFTNFVMQ